LSPAPAYAARHGNCDGGGYGRIRGSSRTASKQGGGRAPALQPEHSVFASPAQAGIHMRSSTRRSMPCSGRREVTSTVTEHETLAARDHVSTHAPGRIEGSREHTNLAIARARDTCATATTSASSPGEPRARDRHARGLTRLSPRSPLRRGAIHDLTRPVSPLDPAGRSALTLIS
jgi:hypothetical protein